MIKNLSLDYSIIKKNKLKNAWKLYIDGASRGNPGLAAAGCYIIKNDQTFLKKGFFLGSKTNNEAEYYGLILGIYQLIFHADFDNEIDHVAIFADSLLLVRQILGEYRVKALHLQSLYHIAMDLLKKVDFSIIHIKREHNTIADRLANYGLEQRSPLSQSFISLCKEYGITV